MRDRSLFFRVSFNGRHSQVNSIPLLDDGPWHNFASVVDQTTQAIMGYLDGSSVGWQTGKSSESIEPDSIMNDQGMIIGGYPDAAGGYFDHTFGRQGTGLVDDFRLYPRAL